MRLLIDCNNVAHIVANAIPDLSTGNQSTGVIYGFLTAIFTLQKQFFPDDMIFCWDSKKSFRKLMYPAYKGNRHKRMDDDDDERERMNSIFEQFLILRTEILPELGFQNIFMHPGFEADDLIANIVKKYPDKEFVIISTDKDLYQLLENTRIIIANPITKKEMNCDLFKQAYSITPDRWVEVKSIAGDKSDNIDGIKGVGEKIAIKYLLGKLPDHHKTYQAIVSEEGQKTMRKIMPIVKLPLNNGMKIKTEIKKKQPLLRRTFRNIFKEYDFESFLIQKNFEQWAQAFVLE